MQANLPQHRRRRAAYGTRFVSALTALALGGPLACGRDESDDPVSGLDGGYDAPALDAGTGDGASPILPDGGVAYFPRLDEVRTLATHNSYARDEPLFDQLFYHRARGLELDLHTAGDHVFDVYHIAVVDSKTSCKSFRDCLRVIRAFHDAVPEHEIITAFLDMADDWDATHKPDDIDQAVNEELGNLVFTPAELLATCKGAKTLRDSVSGSCGWPRLDALRGRVMLGMTAKDGGKLCTGGGTLRTYASPSAVARPVFLVPEISDACGIAEYDAMDDVVIANLDGGHLSAGPSLAARHLLSRAFKGGFTTRGGFNDAQGFNSAKASLVNFIVSDLVNADADPFVRLYSGTGFPFECRVASACAPAMRELGAFIAGKVTSGDLGGSSDSGLFRYLSSPTKDGFSEWKVAIGAPSSNVEQLAKGCIMARAEAAENSAYAAICRPADNNRARLQVRATKGGTTNVSEIVLPSAFSSEIRGIVQELSVAGGKLRKRLLCDCVLKGGRVDRVILPPREDRAPERFEYFVPFLVRAC